MNFDTMTVVIVVIAFFVVLFAIKLVAGALGGKEKTGGTTNVDKSCASCGWKGKVSKFHRKCPKCGTELV